MIRTLTILASMQDEHTADEATRAADIATQLESFDIESGEHSTRCTGKTYETSDPRCTGLPN